MASNPNSTLAPKVAEPQHYEPPSARELRAQAVQRLQVGLFGLAAMLLLVGLANIIIEQVLKNTASAPAATSSAASSEGKSDPLADIGVMPAAEPSAKPSGSAPPR